MKKFLYLLLLTVIVVGIVYYALDWDKQIEPAEVSDEMIEDLTAEEPSDDEIDDKFKRVTITVDDNMYHEKGCTAISGMTMRVPILDAEEEGASPCPVCYGVDW